MVLSMPTLTALWACLQAEEAAKQEKAFLQQQAQAAEARAAEARASEARAVQASKREQRGGLVCSSIIQDFATCQKCTWRIWSP